jgi:hypothetical protein
LFYGALSAVALTLGSGARRLRAYERAAHPSGLGGAQIVLQQMYRPRRPLSDYFPRLIVGAFGRSSSSLIYKHFIRMA